MRIKIRLEGVSKEGAGLSARLTTGLRVDRPRPRSMVRKKGLVLDAEDASRELMLLRSRQVGRKAASATMVKCQGMWLGGPGEPTLVCEIEHAPSPRERGAVAFERHMTALAEQAAERFGQKEVWVKIGADLYRANAPGEKGPKPMRRGGKVIR